VNRLDDFFRRVRTRAEAALAARIPDNHTPPARLHAAMRYATLDGGKRLRAALVYAVGESLGADDALLDSPACALELIHAYSLIHDDLPAMDNDDLRRGKPTVHRAYDEATAILAGDALQALAFEILAHDPMPGLRGEIKLAMILRLAEASGSIGMAGGQAIDLDAVGKSLTLAELKDMHARKTGALIRAAVALGALAADAPAEQLALLDRYAKEIGLAFQIVDDILDIEGDTATLGKPQGSDEQRGKPTYPAILGLEKARALARECHVNALESIASLGDNGRLLRDIADFILQRTH